MPEHDLVAPYSLEVVYYYVAGWPLQRTSLALKAPEGERHKYFENDDVEDGDREQEEEDYTYEESDDEQS